MTRVELRISGLGGQGVVLAGQVLGHAAVYDGKSVVQTQSYGAEARGSAAKSEIILSDEKIGFPHVRKCDILVAMSQSALDVHLKDLKEKGILLIDEQLVKKIPNIGAKIYKVPSTDVARSQLKSKIYANIIMLGVLAKKTKIVSREALEKAITSSVRPETVETNLNALKLGFRL